MNQWVFESASQSETDRLGATLAEILPNRSCIALNGTLGAGKTRLTQALAEACGIERQDVTSPTFVLCQHYEGSRKIYHLDAYRIQDDDEFLELGVDEYFESEGITIVEWAERVARCLPSSRLDINVEVAGDQLRLFRVTAVGDEQQPVVELLANKLQ